MPTLVTRYLTSEAQPFPASSRVGVKRALAFRARSGLPSIPKAYPRAMRGKQLQGLSLIDKLIPKSPTPSRFPVERRMECVIELQWQSKEYLFVPQVGR